MEVREPVALYGKKKFTVEEYLSFEEDSIEKHEYFRGEIFAIHGAGFSAMAGATLDHNIIAGNFFSELKRQLKGKSCRPFNSDQRIFVPANHLFTYPDISVVCGSPKTKDNDQLNLLNPSVIIEVLSAGTRNYDRGEKFNLYRAISTLREYITVDSRSVTAERWFVNANDRWELQEFKNSGQQINIEALNVIISLWDIYDGTQAVTIL